MILDTGAKRTYITSDKARELGLRFGPTRSVCLNTFGEKKFNETILGIRLKDGSIKLLKVKLFKVITGPMTERSINKDSYKDIWKDLDMAAGGLLKNGDKCSIELLIGNDYYDDLMKTEKILLILLILRLDGCFQEEFRVKK